MTVSWETVALTLAAVPAALFFWNLWFFRRLPKTAKSDRQVSVLIPARDEEGSIGEAVEAVLASRGVELEVVVCDDGSTDRTAEIVEGIASRDPRVRLIATPALPAGWCGKQFACHTLAGAARHPVLCFLDADVRLTPDAMARMARALGERRLSLISGFPRQMAVTFAEQLLIPLIHFVLLGFLPMIFAKRTRYAAFASGCGQLMMADAADYRSAGGHGAIRQSLHDGIRLPRLFRSRGLRTDVFDATDLASCRMYASARQVWLGLAKNATEGMAAPVAIFVFTALLAGGQLLPWALLAAEGWSAALAVAIGLTYLPRLWGVVQFRQPLLGAVLHPLGIAGLLAIQWYARIRAWAGRPAVWKTRQYSSAAHS
jgi:hypothetical protein